MTDRPLRIVISTQQLIIGGSNLNAIDIGQELARRGHAIIVYGQQGPLTERLAELGLDYAPAPGEGSLTAQWPSARSAAELRRVVSRTNADVVHTYEWPACLDALVGTYLLDGTPIASSIMSMRVPRFMPKAIPLIVGTRALRDEVLRRGFDRATVIEPPVDLSEDSPWDDPTPARRQLGLDEGDLVVGIVARLGGSKVEGIHTAISAMERAEPTSRTRLVIAGDGPAGDELRTRAREVNDRVGMTRVKMLGEVADPRPVYAASDIIIGMGGSALRALAFSKPLIVNGVGGYCEVFTPESSGEFLVQGFWGLGEGHDGTNRLVAALHQLEDPGARRQLGVFGREFVQRFALPQAAERVEQVLRTSAAAPAGRPARRRQVASALVRLAGVRAQDGLRRAASRRRRA